MNADDITVSEVVPADEMKKLRAVHAAAVAINAQLERYGYLYDYDAPAEALSAALAGEDS